jgi:predicted PurR-regulated permease PerM
MTMELKDLFASPEAMKWLAMIAASVIVVLVTALIGAVSLKLTAKQIQTAKYYWSEWGAKLREQVDEPGDPLNVTIDKLLDRLWEANWNVFVSTLATALIDAVSQHVPPREVNIAEIIPKS